MGLFEWIGNTVANYSSKREETYQWVQDANWDSIYTMLKKENAFSAKAQGLMRALAEKLEEEDTDRLRQFYEHEVKHSAEKTNHGGFMVLRKEMERRGMY